jgi:hypothetical protein
VSKTPKAGKQTSGKRPSIAPDSTLGEKVRFRFNLVDVDGPWCLSAITPDDHKELIRKLGNFESMTVGEIFTGGYPGKDYEFDGCPNAEAVRRLFELHQTSEISRLRVSGAGRLYGIRQRNEFAIVWYDPKHQIWPSAS